MSALESIKVRRLDPDAQLPTRAHPTDAGLDLYVGPTWLSIRFEPGECWSVGTGIAVEIPPGYVGLVHPRSGLSRYGLIIPNAPGTIDAGYTGEIKVLLRNVGTEAQYVDQGQRIAQLVIQKVELPAVVEVEELEQTERGANGFGSTGA